jgi:hypothetical protein
MINYVINLDHRKDRWEDVIKELERVKIYATRFSGFNNGWKGCRDSHIAILNKSQDEVAVTIFEDDVLFIEDIEYVSEAILQLPKDWDCLYLGGSPQQPQERYSDNLFKANNVKVSHAILWHPRPDGAVDYILNHIWSIGKWDRYLAETIQPKFNCFMTFPMICSQRQSFSDTCRRSDASSILKNYQKYCV